MVRHQNTKGRFWPSAVTKSESLSNVTVAYDWRTSTLWTRCGFSQFRVDDYWCDWTPTREQRQAWIEEGALYVEIELERWANGSLPVVAPVSAWRWKLGVHLVVLHLRSWLPGALGELLLGKPVVRLWKTSARKKKRCRAYCARTYLEWAY